MKVLLGHLDWELGTIDPHSDPADKDFLGLHIVSNVSKWSNLLLKIEKKLLSLGRNTTEKSKFKKCYLGASVWVLKPII